MIVLSAVLASATSAHRYWIPIIFGAIFLSPFLVDRLLTAKKYGLVILLIALCLPTVATSYSKYTEHSINDYQKLEIHKFASFLRDHGLEFGFAGPWQTNVITINFYSGGDVKVANVDFLENKVVPHRHADKIWYSEKFHQERHFSLFRSISWQQNAKFDNLKKLPLKSKGSTIGLY